MALKGFSQLGRSIHDEGKFHYQYFYKPTVPANTLAGYFIDLNQSSGVPKYNPFAGSELTATPLIGLGNGGIYPGNFIPGKSKYLLRWQMQNLATAPNLCYLNDYLSFYPLIDCDNIDQQDMINVDPLPRYTNGDGVQIVLVASAPMVLPALLTITYTNSDGVSGRTSTANVIPAAAIGVCATGTSLALGGAGQASPFWPLADGDKGVRSIESVQFASGAGGFIIACLVKPIAQLSILEANVAIEKTFGFDETKLPEIKDGAYLNMLIQCGNTPTSNFRGELIFINE